MKLRYFSGFAGIGGFDQGITQVLPEAKCVGYSEVDKYAIKIYEKHFPDRINYGDIRRIDTGTLPDFDMFCGGFPCQDLSIIGKRKGLCGARSGLFFEIIRVIREKQPRLVFLENVKGLFSSNNGWDFARILIELDESGYDVEWQCLNSKNFGVPQNRERVFIIGHSRNRPWKPVFPIRRKGKEDNGSNQIFCIDTKKQGLPRLNHCCPTLQESGYKEQIKIYNNGAIRKLTPVECERLQGFADNYTAGLSDTQRYRCLGNAVTVNVIDAIVRRMHETEYRPKSHDTPL